MTDETQAAIEYRKKYYKKFQYPDSYDLIETDVQEAFKAGVEWERNHK